MKEIVAGVDIGGTNTVYGLVDKSGKLLAEGSLKTTKYPDIKDFVAALTSAISGLVSKDKTLKLGAIGIGAPDANYLRGTIEDAPNLAWKGLFPLLILSKKRLMFRLFLLMMPMLLQWER